MPTSDDRQAVELLARTAAVAIERSRDAQLRANQLSELQTSLLPRALPDVPGLQAAASFHSGDRSLEVGGDFYDLFPLDDGVWGLVVGDVCGHGAEAAAVTALTRHSAWSHARMYEDPDQVLAGVSEALLARGYDGTARPSTVGCSALTQAPGCGSRSAGTRRRWSAVPTVRS